MALKFDTTPAMTKYMVQQYTTPAVVNVAPPQITPQIETQQLPTLTMPQIGATTTPQLGLNGLVSLPDDFNALTLTSDNSDFGQWLRSNLTLAKSSTPTEAVDTLTSNLSAQISDLNASVGGLQQSVQQGTQAYQKYLQRADTLNKISTVAQIGSSIMGGLEMNDYLDEVKATKDQYETQKQIIDTNIANSETLLMERYRENVADLEVMAAAKNVDPTSGALQSLKDQGAIDMGKDFAIARTNADLQKQALDLQYAMSVRQAARQTKNYWQNAAFDTAFSIGKAFIF